MLRNYFMTALAVLKRRRFFTFISMFAITFTLVVLIVASALLDFIFAPHAPEQFADRTLGVYSMGMWGERMGTTAWGGYRVLNEHLRDLPGAERVTLVRVAAPANAYISGRKERLWLKFSDAEFWKVYGFRFLEGSAFSENDLRGARPVAVINESTRRKFFGDANAVGKTIEVNGQTFRVSGVVENVAATRIVPFGDVYAPLTTAKSDEYKRLFVGDFFGIVVAKDRSYFPAMQKEFAARLRRVKLDDPQYTQLNGALETPFEAISRMMFSNRLDRSHKNTLRTLLLALAVLFMLLPAVNLMNITVSRMLERSGEIGVRKAFGASSATIVGQFVVENIIVTLLGGIISLIVAQFLLVLLNRSGVILYGDLHLNLRLVAYAFAFAVFFGVLSGLYPAWRMSRLHPAIALRGGHQ